jgi:hypothetical protein
MIFLGNGSQVSTPAQDAKAIATELGPIAGIAFSKNGDRLIVVGSESRMTVWQTDGSKLVKTIWFLPGGGVNWAADYGTPGLVNAQS